MSDMPELKERVKRKFVEYTKYTRRWSGAYWGAVFGAAILSALSALLPTLA